MNIAHNIEYEEAPSGNVVFYNYKEPLMKFEGYDGNEGFGFVGALVFDSGTGDIQCSLCGTWHKVLGNHLHREHGMSANDYRRIVGLNRKTALVNEEVRAKLIEHGKTNHKNRRNLRPGGKQPKAVREHIRATLKENRNEQKNLRNTCPEQLLERFVKLVKEVGYVPGTKDPRFGFYETLRKTYGSMQRVGELTGIDCRKVGQNRDYSNRTRKWPEQKLVEFVRNFYDENGRLPKGKDFGHGESLTSSITRLGRAKIFKKALMMDGRYRKAEIIVKYTKDELLDFLRSFEKINGRRPSCSDCRRGLLPHFGRYYYNFGSWKKALKLAFTEEEI